MELVIPPVQKVSHILSVVFLFLQLSLLLMVIIRQINHINKLDRLFLNVMKSGRKYLLSVKNCLFNDYLFCKDIKIKSKSRNSTKKIRKKLQFFLIYPSFCINTPNRELEISSRQTNKTNYYTIYSILNVRILFIIHQCHPNDIEHLLNYFIGTYLSFNIKKCHSQDFQVSIFWFKVL